MRCEAVAEQLSGRAPGRRVADRRTARHVATCLRCQAELARSNATARRLQALRSGRPEVPPGLVGDVLAALDAAATRRTARRALAGRGSAYAGAAALAALGVGVAVALVGRRRTPGPLGTGGVSGGSLSDRPCDRLPVRGMAIVRGQ